MQETIRGVVVALILLAVGAFSALALAEDASASPLVQPGAAAIDVSVSETVSCSHVYDYRSDLARPPPAEVETNGYDSSSNLPDPVADGGWVRRVFSGFVADRVAPSSAVDDLARPALPRGGANLSQQRLDHIVERHWFGSQTANAGHFAQGTTGRGLTSMIDDAVRNGSFRPNTGGRPGTIFEYDFGSSIGTNIGGNATSRLRVVVDPNGNVITAFPH